MTNLTFEGIKELVALFFRETTFFTPEDIKAFIINLFFGGLGFASSLLVEVYKKRKSKKIEDSEIVTQINLAASENIKTTQELLETIDKMRITEREYFEEQIKRSRAECEKNILDLKESHEKSLEDKIAEIKEKYDKEFNDFKEKSEREKTELMEKIDKLETDKVNLQDNVRELTETISKIKKRKTDNYSNNE